MVSRNGRYCQDQTPFIVLNLGRSSPRACTRVQSMQWDRTMIQRSAQKATKFLSPRCLGIHMVGGVRTICSGVSAWAMIFLRPMGLTRLIILVHTILWADKTRCIKLRNRTSGRKRRLRTLHESIPCSSPCCRAETQHGYVHVKEADLLVRSETFPTWEVPNMSQQRWNLVCNESCLLRSLKLLSGLNVQAWLDETHS